jgi:hypothetical protein
MPVTTELVLTPEQAALVDRWISYSERAPIPTGPPEWEIRESCRFLDGEYKWLPWHQEGWWRGSIAFRDHYAHVSNDDPSKIAYTPSERHGIEDRQVRVKPGRYLNKYFSNTLGPQEIQFWAGKFAGENEQLELKFAHTPDEIERVYKEGPHSCMKADFSSPVHPARVYGAGDLAVAYLEDEEHITARCVVWPEKLAKSTVYGDDARLGTALVNAGYSSDNRFTGAKLLAIEASSGFVAPYIDGGYHVEYDGDYLILGSTGIPCNSTSGIVGAFCCPRCEEYEDEDSSVYVNGAGESWCESCYENYAFHCEHCQESHPQGDEVWIEGEHEAWCEDCASDDAFSCGKCDTWNSTDEINTVGDECWCQDCFDHHAFVCDKCGDTKIDSDNRIVVDDETWCEKCTMDYAGLCEHCEEYSHADKMVRVRDENWCAACAKSDASECDECGDMTPDTKLCSVSDTKYHCEGCRP